MIQLHLEKAFDRVPHDFLFLILEYINVGSVILEGVRMAYNRCTTSLIINNVGKQIQVERSVRQGCPLSPLLFCIFIESFCLSVTKSENIQGFLFHAAEVGKLAYADDVAVFRTNYKSVFEVVQVVKRFCEASGSSVNWGKSLGFWHDNWPATPGILANKQWVTSPVQRRLY